MSYDFLIKFTGTGAANSLYFSMSNDDVKRLKDTMSKKGLLDFDFKGVPLPPVKSRFKGPVGNIAYERALDRYLSFHRRNNKIPAYKLSSNIGWKLTAEECQTIYAAFSTYEDMSDPDWSQKVRNFAAFCLTSTKFGGFSVY